MSTRRWRRAAVVAAAGLVSFTPSLLAVPAHGAADTPRSPAFAQVDPGSAGEEPDGTVAEEPTATDAGAGTDNSSNIESVTVTETKLRRVVIGLIAIAALTAVLTVGYARHTSPKRRAKAAAEREQARARRLAAAAAVGGLGPATPTSKPPVARLRPPAEEELQRASERPAPEPSSTNAPPRSRRANGSPATRPRNRVRPDPRPQPRSRG